MRYKGFIIERKFGHYEIKEGRDLVATADTIAEAKDVCDDIICERNAEYESLAFTGQWW